jgi:hypothetical protein
MRLRDFAATYNLLADYEAAELCNHHSAACFIALTAALDM